MPRLTLPEPPQPPIDRVALGAQRWTLLLHKRDATFAAACAGFKSRFDAQMPRENAKRAIRVTQANGYMNGRELITALDILTHWDEAEPGAQMAIIILVTEIGGASQREDDARVLTGKRWQ